MLKSVWGDHDESLSGRSARLLDVHRTPNGAPGPAVGAPFAFSTHAWNERRRETVHAADLRVIDHAVGYFTLARSPSGIGTPRNQDRTPKDGKAPHLLAAFIAGRAPFASPTVDGRG